MDRPSPKSPLPLEAHLGELEAAMVAAQRRRETLDELFARIRARRRNGWGSVLPVL